MRRFASFLILSQIFWLMGLGCSGGANPAAGPAGGTPAELNDHTTGGNLPPPPPTTTVASATPPSQPTQEHIPTDQARAAV